MNEKAVLEFGASLCHRNSKRLVVKSCRKFTFVLKSQNSPQIQAKQNKENMRTAKKTTLSLALFTTESQNNYYLARLYKWGINLTNWIGTVIAGTKFI